MMVRRARFLAPIALAALSIAAALSLGDVVESNRFVLPVIGAAVLPHAIGALTRWRGWSKWIGLALTVAALVVYVVVALEWSTTKLGVPTADTWHTIDRQLSGGWHLLRTAPAPAPTTDGAILLAVLAVWCMAAFADWLAFWRQTALAATAPALVFFVWTSTLGTDDVQAALTVAFCAAVGAFLLAQNVALLDQRRSWLVSQRGAHPRWLAPAALLGGTAIVVALVVAPLVPGAGSDPLLDVAGNGRNGSGGHSYQPEIPPFVDIGRKLDTVDDVELFTVDSNTPDYWRIAALDKYSSDGGGRWTLSAEGDGSVEVGLPSQAPAGALRQDFHIGPMGERWLPAAYQPVAINLDDTLVVKSSGTIVANAPRVTGLRYTVESDLPPLAGSPISPEQIAATADPVPADLRRYEALPDSPDMQEIAAMAQRIVDNAGATTPYAKAQALRNYFRDPANNFVYDTTVGSDDSGAAILDFLHSQHGYCVQFASAYAVMARSLKIPARVAVGFTPGKRDANGTYHVTSHDAHAWPEIYLSGLGWTHLFDPTPSNQHSSTGGSELPNDVDGATPVTTVPPRTANTVPPAGANGAPSSGNGTTPGTTPAPRTVPPAGKHASSGTGAWLLIVAIVAALVLAAGGYVGAVLALKRRRRNRRHHATDPVFAVTGAWEEALDRLHEAAVVPRPAQTPLDLAASVRRGTSVATAAPMHELARVYGAARYGEGAVAGDDARAAWESLDELERALDDGVRWSTRWRRRLDVSTLAHHRR
jgi:transglutaminase-like putative cysteine protease